MNLKTDAATAFTEAGFPKLATVYMHHKRLDTIVVKVSNIPLSHDHNLSNIKQKLHNRIGTPFAPPRKFGKGTTEFQLGGLMPRDAVGELHVSGYLAAIANFITDLSNDELRSLQFVALQTLPHQKQPAA